MTAIIDEQLNWITDLLDKHHIDYFLNDGTLIGIMRNGKLIEWDKDIDIAIFEKDITKMKKIMQIAALRGYDVGTSEYSGKIYGFHITPNTFLWKLFYPYIPKNMIKGNRKIDISVLRQNKGRLWKPVLFSKGSDKTGFTYYLYKIIRGTNTIIGRIFRTQVIKTLSSVGTCSVPAKYFMTKRSYMGFNVPYLAEEYLEFKYGNWRIPIKKWSYMRDDNSCNSASPFNKK